MQEMKDPNVQQEKNLVGNGNRKWGKGEKKKDQQSLVYYE